MYSKHTHLEDHVMRLTKQPLSFPQDQRWEVTRSGYSLSTATEVWCTWQLLVYDKFVSCCTATEASLCTHLHVSYSNLLGDSQQQNHWTWITQSGMGGGDDGYCSGLLGATPNKQITFPRQNHIHPLGLGCSVWGMNLYRGESTVYALESKGHGNSLFFTTLSTFKFSSGNNYVACG